MTVQEIIDAVIKKTGVQLTPQETCDRLIAGNPDMEVAGIATTFMATVEVIQKAAAEGVNLIITHEPTWFTGRDDTQWLENDPVYIEKRKLIEKSGIAIWRFHDHMHMGTEDGIYRGFDLETGWKDYRISDCKGIHNCGVCYEIPEMTLEQLCCFFKEKNGMEVVQIVGNPQMSVKRVGVMVGGGSLGLGIEACPMQMMRENQLDAAVCGEITEWTLSAYIRDACSLGMNNGMLVLGHERSEEMGMKHLVSWLEELLSGMRIIFIDAQEPFAYM